MSSSLLLYLVDVERCFTRLDSHVVGALSESARA
jgi:hypothetical protein